MATKESLEEMQHQLGDQDNTAQIPMLAASLLAVAILEAALYIGGILQAMHDLRLSRAGT